MPSLPLSSVLSILPVDLQAALLEAFNNVRQNYIERRWEPSELNGGKFCEAVYRILEWHTSNIRQYTPLGSDIKDFKTSVRRFESQSSQPDSIRFHIPHALIFLYTVRNKRGVGHLSGDINPNHMDAEIVLSTTNWLMAELVRILHSVSITEAQDVVESLVAKRSPLVWEAAGFKRILNPAVEHKDRVLLLLHNSHPKPIAETDLFRWTEYSDASSFRTRVLQKMHKERLIEYDSVKQLVYLSPIGVVEAEQLLLQYQENFR